MNNSVACHRTHSRKLLNAARDRRHACSSHEPRVAARSVRFFRLRVAATVRALRKSPGRLQWHAMQFGS
jgi:hypothetical protein